MINQTTLRKQHDKVRDWGRKHKAEIFKHFNNACADCGSTDKLTIHHTKYEIGIKNCKVLCNSCHRKFHDLELQKKLLIYALADFKRNNIPNEMTVGEYKRLLWKRIDEIPIDIAVKGRVDGIPEDFNFEV